MDAQLAVMCRVWVEAEWSWRGSGGVLYWEELAVEGDGSVEGCDVSWRGGGSGQLVDVTESRVRPYRSL